MLADILFSPRSLALTADLSGNDPEAERVLANLESASFPGVAHLVDTSGQAPPERAALSRLIDQPDPVDMVAVLAPPEGILQAARDAAARKARLLILLGDAGPEPRRTAIQRNLGGICRQSRMRLLGPDSMGLISVSAGVNLSRIGRQPRPGRVAVFSRSGALCTAIHGMAAWYDLGISRIVSMGHAWDIDEVDLLQALGRDAESRVIAGYLENIGDGDAFVKSAEQVSRDRPLILFKAGVSSEGHRVAAFLGRRDTGAEPAFEAAFRRAGICRAHSFEALFDTALGMALQPLPAGSRARIISSATGPGVMAADALDAAGFTCAPLEDGRLLEVPGRAGPKRYVQVLRQALADPGVDAVFIVLAPGAMPRPLPTARAMAAVCDGSKPVVIAFLGGGDRLRGLQDITRRGMPCYPSPERGAGVLAAMLSYHQWRGRPPRQVTRFPVNRRRAARIVGRRRRTGRLRLGEIQAKDILRAYGFLVPRGRLAADLEEAVEIAGHLGYPVALKVVSPDIVQKSDLGGVRLDLAGRRAVEDAYDLMMLRIARLAPKARVEGIYVEEMVAPGLEVILGMRRDPQFGPMLMFGLGGIFVEVLEERAFHLAPITHGEALDMLRATRSYAMLEGRRGSSGVDIEAVAVALQRISQLAGDFPDIIEIDINPMIVHDTGGEAVVADARMRLAPPGGE